MGPLVAPPAPHPLNQKCPSSQSGTTTMATKAKSLPSASCSRGIPCCPVLVVLSFIRRRQCWSSHMMFFPPGKVARTQGHHEDVGVRGTYTPGEKFAPYSGLQDHMRLGTRVEHEPDPGPTPLQEGLVPRWRIRSATWTLLGAAPHLSIGLELLHTVATPIHRAREPTTPPLRASKAASIGADVTSATGSSPSAQAMLACPL